jgi:hypothetical protein
MNKKKIEELKRELAECIYRQSGYFPAPYWKQRELEILREIKELKKKRK